MSETVQNNDSTESLCTVIENGYSNTPRKAITLHGFTTTDHDKKNGYTDTDEEAPLKRVTFSETEHTGTGGSYSSETDCDKTSPKEATKIRSKLKKSVSFDPNDEKIQKFTDGDPIIDKQNPFKSNALNGNCIKKKRNPPPVPAKRSTLSVKKTVTQQLREREREKEKERERLKNQANNRKSHSNNSTVLNSPDEFITTEEVLKQSKYVKTYIKNPDPYFVYDPTILARIKFEELREIAGKKPQKKLKVTGSTRERIRDSRNKPTDAALKTPPSFKKCSKPNYPNLSDIKIKVGTEPDGNYFNPAEVSKNAKKFDERVKKLHIGSEDDLDEIDGPLTKSESSDEVTPNNISNQREHLENSASLKPGIMNGDSFEELPVDGTFTGTIKSKEFQQYLDKKGLTLIPKKIPNGAQPVYSRDSLARTQTSINTPQEASISVGEMDSPRNTKKTSVFQRLLSNSIFASKRRTTPKETVPTPRTLYDPSSRTKTNVGSTTPIIKRVVLERQSFHGHPRTTNLLNCSEGNDFRPPSEHTRRITTNGDDLSVSISSALTNAEYPDEKLLLPTNNLPLSAMSRLDKPSQPIAKPPRRTLSRDRMSTGLPSRQTEQRDTLIRPKVQRPEAANSILQFQGPNTEGALDFYADGGNFKRTVERQSLIPRRSSQANDNRQIFGRSASMDRHEILKRSAARALQNRSKCVNGPTNPSTATADVKEILPNPTRTRNGPSLTSTPKRETRDQSINEAKTLSPILQYSKKPPPGIFMEQHEWDRLRTMKEHTDRELYYKMLQAQQRAQATENIYEHLQPNQAIIPRTTQNSQGSIPPTIQKSQGSIPHTTKNSQGSIPHTTHTSQRPQLAETSFVRGSPQRNTFSGVIRHRQTKIIDGRAVLAVEEPRSMPVGTAKPLHSQPTERSQSALDGVTHGFRNNYRPGNESGTESSVVMRRREVQANQLLQPERRIGGILTREEILQKVKEFCRKSLNKTPTNHLQVQAVNPIYSKKHVDISPVSYASVETHQRPGSRMFAAPQVPQRMHSLPQQFVPISKELNETNASSSSPIYAHVVKRSSLQSNQSDPFENSHRPYLLRRESDTQALYLGSATLQRPEDIFVPTQYVIVDSEKLAPQELNYYPQYVRQTQLQPIPQYGYITVREAMPPPQQQFRPRLHDGRSTPLILDRSSQQASQIYWTPQRQRLQQHSGLLPVQISPRYMPKQSYAVAAPDSRTDHPNSRAVRVSPLQIINLPQQTNHYTPAQLSHANTAIEQTQQMVQPNGHHPYEWESGSEAGEVQRIMEHQRNSGEFKAYNIFRNLKNRMSKLMGSYKR